MSEQGLVTRQPFGFDEKFAESRMRAIGPMRCEGELEVSGHLKAARFARGIDQSDAPDFGIVFCGDDNFCESLAWPTCPPELRFVRRETPSVTTLWTSHRLMGVAPDRAAFQIPDITNRARHIARGVGTPACDIQIQPAQVTAAGIGHHHRTGSVGKKMNARRGKIGRLRYAGAALHRNRSRQRSLFMHVAGGRQNLFGNMLVQERFSSANARVGMEPPTHRVIM